MKNIGLKPTRRDEDTSIQDVFYRPDKLIHRRSCQRCWDYRHPDGTRDNYRIKGYFWLLYELNAQGKSVRPEIESSGNKRNRNCIRKTNMKSATDAGLVIDVTLSDPTSPQQAATHICQS